MTKTAALIAERGKTHGDFGANADTAQAIKSAIRSAPNWNALSGRQQEALDLIATKIGRIMSGNPNERDHWRDVSGYAELVASKL